VLDELRVPVAMTARPSYIAPAHEEWDAIKATREGSWTRLARSLGIAKEEIGAPTRREGIPTSGSGAHPAEGYPCRATLVE
jgi:hypothetical protein